jgi:ribonucleoside-diphosphate reductase alpha chain
MTDELIRKRIEKLQDDSVFGSKLYNNYEFLSWARWYPDLFIDLLKTEKSNFNLHLDQRVFLRSDVRFMNMYGVFSRGYAKTFNEVLSSVIVAILFPEIELAISAQTKENAADLLKSKFNEIRKKYPLIENELACEPKFIKGDALITFKNGSTIDAIANAQSTKGQRRRRLKIEEAALLNNVLFEDALEPVTEVPRYAVGNLALVDPEELNQQIHFFTTSGFRGSDEYYRSVKMYDDMCDLKGQIVLGSNWMLPCWFGRGSNKSQILKKKKNSSPIAFAQNYEQEWVGSSDGALVDINKLMNCRTLTTPMINKNKNEEEFYLGVDVARSQKSSNNQSSIAVGRVIRNKDTNRILSIEIPNIFTVSNSMNFTAQACIVKRTKNAFGAKMVIADGNGLGSGLIDELLKDSYDPISGEYLGCWDTINTDNQPETIGAEKCLFDMKAQSYQSKVITNFINSVDSGQLRLLAKKQEAEFTSKDKENIELNILPYAQTDLLFEEIANLKLKPALNGALAIEKVVKKLDKDRFSALAYLIWYILEYTSFIQKNNFNAQSYAKSLSKLNHKPKMY